MKSRLMTIPLALGALVGAHQAAAQPVAIGTLPQGSLAYAIASAVAKVGTEKGGLNMRVVGTGGSNVYIPQISRGEVAFGTSNLFESKFAITGTGNFPGRRNPNVRIVALLMPFAVGIMVARDTGIKELTQLRGKAFPVGYARQKLVAVMQTAIFNGVGMKESELDGVPVPNFVKAAGLLAQGKLTGLLLAPGSGIVKRTAARRAVRFINIPNTPAVRKSLSDALPGTRLVLVKPHKRFVSIAEPVHLIGYQYAIIAGSKTNADAVYKLAKALYNGKKELAAAHGIFRRFNPKRMASVTDVVPFHPGAIRFYKEAGIWKGK
jgi:TRAP transporter TAXI family solute receptor